MLVIDVKLIGGVSVDLNRVNSDAAQFPEPSMVSAGQSADEVCAEASRLAAEKEGIENDPSVRF